MTPRRVGGAPPLLLLRLLRLLHLPLLLLRRLRPRRRRLLLLPLLLELLLIEQQWLELLLLCLLHLHATLRGEALPAALVARVVGAERATALVRIAWPTRAAVANPAAAAATCCRRPIRRRPTGPSA